MKVEVTDAARLEAIRRLFAAATPRLRPGDSMAMTRGAKLATAVHGEITVRTVDGERSMWFVAQDRLMPNRFTMVQLAPYVAFDLERALTGSAGTDQGWGRKGSASE